jgi:HNH endonuclease
MHRLNMNAPNGVDIDHRDHDGLNNQKLNLRLCTQTQNNQNLNVRKDNTFGYKGVSLEPSTGHWRPLIYANGKAHTCGQFLKKKHAAFARDLWAVDLHGEFANTNFPVIAFGP